MRKTMISLFLTGVLVVLAGCAPAATPTPAPQTFAGAGANNGANGPRPLNIESKLEMGTLKLEGTGNAVTTSEAVTLLPLWQKAKTLIDTPARANADIQTAFTDIQNAMTADQMSAIDQMNLTQSDLQTMMQQLGIQVTPLASGGTPFPTLSADERATRTAQRETQVAGGGTGGAGNGTGGTGGNSFTGGGAGRGGFGNPFIDPVINLLTQRAAG